MQRILSFVLASGTFLLLGACGSDDAGLSDETHEDIDHAVEIVATIGKAAISLQAHGQDADGPISIEPIEESAGMEGQVAAFRLLPAGARFERPVTVSVTAPGEPLPSLRGLHFSDEAAVELLEFLPTSYDAEASATTYETQVSHFSEIYVGEWGDRVEMRIMRPLPEEQYLVGESFTLKVRVLPDDIPSRDYPVRDDGTQVRTAPTRGVPMKLAVGWHTSGESRQYDFIDAASFLLNAPDEFGPSPLTPKRLDPPTGDVSAGEILDFEQQFTCERAGRFYVWFQGSINQRGTLTEFSGAEVIGSREQVFVASSSVGITGECVPAGDESTATPTRTEPETATAIAQGGPVPTVVLPIEPRIPTPVVPGQDLEGFILVYAYDGAWYDASTLVVTPAHEPFCSYEHLHGGPIESILSGPSGQTTTIEEMYGECGYGPTDALYWIEDPR